MSEALSIHHDETGHQFEVNIDGHRAYLTYMDLGKQTLDIYRTFVPNELRGRGIAAALTEVALNYADDIGYTSARLAAFTAGQHVLEFGVHAAQGFLGAFPIDACIGDGHAVLQIGEVFGNCLTAPVQMTLDHQPDDRFVAFENLVGDVFHHQRLQRRVFVGVGVAAIDHDVRLDLRLVQRLLAQSNADRVVVGLAVAAAQYDMAGIDRDRQTTVGAVLEADGRRQARRHFPVGLGFGGARADGRPTDEVLQILRRNRAVILAVENVADDFATLADRGLGGRGQRDFAFQLIRGDQCLVGGNVEVVNRALAHPSTMGKRGFRPTVAALSDLFRRRNRTSGVPHSSRSRCHSAIHGKAGPARTGDGHTISRTSFRGEARGSTAIDGLRPRPATAGAAGRVTADFHQPGLLQLPLGPPSSAGAIDPCGSSVLDRRRGKWRRGAALRRFSPAGDVRGAGRRILRPAAHANIPRGDHRRAGGRIGHCARRTSLNRSKHERKRNQTPYRHHRHGCDRRVLRRDAGAGRLRRAWPAEAQQGAGLRLRCRHAAVRLAADRRQDHWQWRGGLRHRAGRRARRQGAAVAKRSGRGGRAAGRTARRTSPFGRAVLRVCASHGAGADHPSGVWRRQYWLPQRPGRRPDAQSLGRAGRLFVSSSRHRFGSDGQPRPGPLAKTGVERALQRPLGVAQCQHHATDGRRRQPRADSRAHGRSGAGRPGVRARAARGLCRAPAQGHRPYAGLPAEHVPR
nr:hypothetical protein [Tanacetum cinerariifolium]